MKFRLIFLPLFLFVLNAHGQGGRTVVDLSDQSWKLWLDTGAAWARDTIFAPPVDLRGLAVHLPTGGWPSLTGAKARTVHLPATVEQHFWGANGNSFGVAGNYLGVSWFTTAFQVPSSAKGKRIILQFESVRFRAEVFVNRKLAGYDLVNGTPFEVDITSLVQAGGFNELAVRITDPNGNFDWRDSQNFMWGDYRTNPTHGFGGITGRVKLVVTDKFYLQDVFIKNKPGPDEIDVIVTSNNGTGRTMEGTLELQLRESAGGRVVHREQHALRNLSPGSAVHSYPVKLAGARPWSVDSPRLYFLDLTWKGADRSQDHLHQRFGFRWFEVRDVNGDKQFYLNGKRIVLITAISWGFWPVNGIAPSGELARRQVESAKKLGLNMLNFHRTIGQQNVLDAADELGLLYFEEPGGNQYPADRFNATDPLGKKQAEFYFATRNEKLFRMIRRDRNHPSLVIYNLHNERGAPPQEQDREQMRAAHRLDETRILTYNSSNGNIQQGPDPRFKLHLLPYDTTFRDYGWFDQHHAGGPGTYHDKLYSGPSEYLRHTSKRDEIIYYGEEGAIGTPPRLQLIREELKKNGAPYGWEGEDYLKWYDAYAGFLERHPGFRKAFPTVDALTLAMGNVAYYYQGRAIENIRINNLVDGYAINGWESMKIENHSGIVDNYRHLKGEASLIARYNQPLYVAVKMNRKVLGVGDTTVVDLYVVNEKNLKGACELVVQAVTDKGNVFFSRTIPVTVSGGVVYGQLLTAGLRLVVPQQGYATVRAELRKNGIKVAGGEDRLFAVQPDASGISSAGMVADTSGMLAPFLTAAGLSPATYTSGRPTGHYLLVGAFQPQQTGNPLVTDILEWVNEGHTLIVVNNIEAWAAHLAQKEVIDYRGSKVLGTTWYGGNYFSRQHPFFEGLPQAQVFNWEYQCFATYNKSRIGLRLFNGDPVVACVADHKKEVYSALSIVPHGRGKIILCALDLFSCLREVRVSARPEGEGENAALNTINASQQNRANLVGQQLLLNLLKYAEQQKN